MSSFRVMAACVVCGSAAGLTGCDRGPKLAPVVGRVTYPDGSPVTGGSVSLVPDDPLVPSPVGEIGPDGRYELYTNKKGDGSRLGSFTAVVAPPGDDYNARKPRPIDRKYEDPATSGFKVTVEDKANTLDLTVTRPGQPAGK